MAAKKQYNYENLKATAIKHGQLQPNETCILRFWEKRYVVAFKGELVFDHAKKSKCEEYLKTLTA
jgi:hypothetical protein